MIDAAVNTHDMNKKETRLTETRISDEDHTSNDTASSARAHPSQSDLYRQTLVDRDGFILAAFTIFSLALMALSIWVTHGIATNYPVATGQNDTPEIFGP